MSEQHEFNSDKQAIAIADADAMAWQQSPSPTVWRKRLHLSGPAEAGVVTSIVRYDPGSAFHAHPHPDGEEILVLEGTFSDEYGDWPAGTYLLNPEGFTHAPFSLAGCVLFVKLRQYAGARTRLAVETSTLAWEATDQPGVTRKVLYGAAEFTDRMSLQRWEAGNEERVLPNDGGIELLVLSGEGRWLPDTPRGDEPGGGPGTWFRFPAGIAPRFIAPKGCELYVKQGHLTG